MKMSMKDSQSANNKYCHWTSASIEMHFNTENLGREGYNNLKKIAV